jgi:hypothetical protein
VHSSQKETSTHVKSWLKFAKSIELARCMMAMMVAGLERQMAKEIERTRVSLERKNLYFSRR